MHTRSHTRTQCPDYDSILYLCLAAVVAFTHRSSCGIRSGGNGVRLCVRLRALIEERPGETLEKLATATMIARIGGVVVVLAARDRILGWLG